MSELKFLEEFSIQTELQELQKNIDSKKEKNHEFE